jgi:CelD/BcsL family acetyltransferase involved in cellulose biosynthesis
VRISRYENVEELTAALATLFELHQMRWTGRGEAGAFASPERRAFYARMADAFLSRGWLEFWRLELEGQTVAAQFCFRYRDTVSLLQEGFDPKYAADKIGYALRAHVLETMIESGLKHYDFLGGSDSYKPKFGARAGSYLNLHFAGPSLLGRALLAKQRRAKQLRRWLKSNLPQRWLAALERPRGQATGA